MFFFIFITHKGTIMILAQKYKKYIYAILLCLISVPIMANNDVALSVNSNYGHFAFACSFTITLVALGGTIAQATTAREALSGIARNPEAYGNIFVTMILALALIESLVIFSLLIAFALVNKIP
jgi:F-type H+-transporting ATPase subunit c